VPNIEHPPVTLADLADRAFAEVWEVAQILQLDRRTVRKACASGDIQSVKAGATYRVSVAWLRQQAGVPE
jgi:excisionase family DNA binding protein